MTAIQRSRAFNAAVNESVKEGRKEYTMMMLIMMMEIETMDLKDMHAWFVGCCFGRHMESQVNSDSGVLA
jgi:hypothetical protein